MSLIVPLVLMMFLGGALLLTAIVLAVLMVRRGRADVQREGAWVRATWLAALVVGVVAAGLVHGALDLGRGTMLVPAVLGLFVVTGVGLGETVVRPRRPAGPRTASLAPRRVSDYLPRALAVALGAVTAAHLGTLVLTTATASADDMGRAGRQVVAQCGAAGAGAGPYPGSFYSVPLAVLLLLIALATLAALVAVARRPRGFAPDDVGDDVLRLRSATRVLSAAGAAVAATHAGVAFFAGTALLRMGCRHAWMTPVGWALVVSVPAALALLGWCVARIVVPGGDVLRPAPMTAPR